MIAERWWTVVGAPHEVTGVASWTAEVHESPPGARLVLRDGAGAEHEVVVPSSCLHDVRGRLRRPRQRRRCVLEVRGADGGLQERWGPFADVGGAAAVGVARLASLPGADHALVVGDDSTATRSLLEVRSLSALREDGTPSWT